MLYNKSAFITHLSYFKNASFSTLIKEQMRRNKLKTKIIKLTGILFLLYLIFSVGKVSYQNWKFNQMTKDLTEEVSLLEAENTNLQNKILYYKTNSYKERIMRERLQYQKPGEEVIVLMAGKQGEDKKDSEEIKISNPRKWWQFLFPQKEET